MRRTAALLITLASLGTHGAAAQSAAAQNGAPAAAAPATTIIFVRHAEAGTDDPRDPSLSDAGRARAQALVQALAAAHVDKVYTSQYQRTRLTGQAVADAAHVKAEVVPVNGATLAADAAALIERIVREHPGGTVLVVGHSNTVPLMVSAATGETIAPIGEGEYDRMFVVTKTALAPDGSRLLRVKY